MATREITTPYSSDPIWQALAGMRIEAAGSPVTFAAKLARETGWTPSRAENVIGEYRRFLYLARTQGEAVSPSDIVDRAWHLHLTYSRHYWDVLCGEILGRPLHHDPNPGGEVEDRRHRSQYERTLEAYERVFGAPAPASIWPRPAAARPGGSGWRGTAVAASAGVGASLLVAACSGGGSGNMAIGWFPIVFVGAIFLIIVIAFAARGQNRGRRSDGSCSAADGGCGSGDSSKGSSSDSSSDGGSSCGGGCGGGGD